MQTSQEDDNAPGHVPTTNGEVLGAVVYKYPGAWSRFYAATVLLMFARAVDKNQAIKTPLPAAWMPSAADLVDNAPVVDTNAWYQWGNGKLSGAEKTRLLGYLNRAALALDAAGSRLFVFEAQSPGTLDKVLDGKASMGDLNLVRLALDDQRGRVPAAAVEDDDDPPVTMPTPAPGRPRLPPQTPIPLPGTLPPIPPLPGPVPRLPPATSSSSSSATRSTSGAGVVIAVIVIAFILGRRK